MVLPWFHCSMALRLFHCSMVLSGSVLGNSLVLPLPPSQSLQTSHLIGSPFSSLLAWFLVPTIFISPLPCPGVKLSPPPPPPPPLHKTSSFFAFFAQKIFVCLSLFTLSAFAKKESKPTELLFHTWKKAPEQYFSCDEKHKKLWWVKIYHVMYVASYGLDMMPSPPIVVVALLCSGGRILAKRLSCPLSGQSQAYAQALQYAYAPNMLTAQQLTAAGL